MRNAEFARWLRKNGSNTDQQIKDTRKIDRVFKDLDRQYERDRLRSAIETLSYSKEDVATKRPDTSGMNFTPKVPSSDERYHQRLFKLFDNSRRLVEKYVAFRDEAADAIVIIDATAADPTRFDPLNDEDAREKVLQSIVVRRGQQQFRDELRRAYGGACSISGCDVLDVLEAAHIARYLGPHTNHVTNGLLLRADLHTLFDCGLITVDPTTLHVIVKPSLLGSEYGAFHEQPLRSTLVKNSTPDPKALKKHMKEVYGTRA